jgi:hypothetical protein
MQPVAKAPWVGMGLAAGLALGGCGQTSLPAQMHDAMPPVHGFIKGQTEAGYQTQVFDDPAVYQSLQQLKTDGVNWLSLQVAWYQKNDASDRIFADAKETPTDPSVNRLIGYVNGLGMRVFLDIFVNSNQPNAWQALFHPNHPQAWFQSYDHYLIHYAKMAQKDHVSLFAIGDEFDSLDDVPQYEPYWARAISDVRRYYHGPITYGADYTHYQKVTFWKLLDVVGVDAYFSLSSVNNPTTAQLKTAWNGLANHIEAWRVYAGLSSKPFVITELGYYSGNGTAQNPGDWTASAPVNLALQKRCYEATFQTIYQRPWLAGLFWFWWANPSNPDWKGGPHDNGYTPRGKPAELVMRYYFHLPHPTPTPAL